ncbi:MAG: T9SS type A sorting domain-containing protein [Ignavibacteria bacterium]|jgi:photosystem II stability/assembly factor-like uncharacterized protein|nr:T9SS type A sorting domain-containing protein [Ignavibacteria bacterium]
MRKKNIIFILLFLTLNFSLLTLNSFSQWVQQSVPVTGGYFNDMKFENANTGFIINWNNPVATLLRTTNAGYNWQTMNNWGMSHIAIVDTNCIYTTGQNNGLGKLYKSTNLGLTWDSMLTTTNYYSYLHFFNHDTGVISGGDSFDNFIWRTTNGGQSLQLIAGFGGASPGKFHFLKEKVNGEYYGWYYYNNNNYLFLTTNSGLNWVSRPSIPENVQSVFFINKDTGWASAYFSRNYIYYTTNGGNNWAIQNLPSSYTIYDIYFANTQKGWASTAYNKVFATNTGGVIWGTQNLPIPFAGHLSFIDSLTGWCGNGNQIAYTTNSGGPITSANNQNELTSKYFLQQNYPNPFNSKTIIKYSISNSSKVILKVYDISGKEISTLVNRNQQKGVYNITVDASNYSSGVYFYKLELIDEKQNKFFVETKRMMYLK